MESWCGGGLIHIHPLPSVLLGGVSRPRGGLPASVAHKLGARICSSGWLPGRVQIYFCLLRCIFFWGGGWLLLGRMSAVPIRARGGVWEAAMPLPGKVHPVLMSPARKQTHHLLCLGGRKLITMCIKHKVAGRCTNGMLSFQPRWCYYVHIRYIQYIIFKCTWTWLKSLSSCETSHAGLVMGLLLYLLNVTATCLQRGPRLFGCLDTAHAAWMRGLFSHTLPFSLSHIHSAATMEFSVIIYRNPAGTLST